MNRAGRGRNRLIFFSMKNRKVVHDPIVEFGVSMHPGPEPERHFLDPKRAGRGGDQVEQDLETEFGKLRKSALDDIPPHDEESGQRIGHLKAEQLVGQPNAGVRNLDTLLGRQPVCPVFGQEPAGRHNIGLILRHGSKHLWQDGFIMLQVTIHDGDDFC
jgi:hypothetical protein